MDRILPYSALLAKAPRQTMGTANGPRSHIFRAAGASLLAALICTPLAGDAAEDAPLTDSIQECMTIQDSQARLECFDAAAAAADASATPGASSEEPAAAAPAQPDPALPHSAPRRQQEAAPAPRQEPSTRGASGAQSPAINPDMVGREQLERPTRAEERVRKEAMRLEAVVAEVYERRDGLLRITLENGQVWQQKSTTSYFRVREGDTVLIKQGLFGGYRLEAKKRSIDVTRVK